MHKQNTQSSPFKSAYIHTCINAEFSLYMPKHIHIYTKICKGCLSRCWLQSLLNGESRSMQAAWQNTIKKRNLIFAILKAGWSQRRQAPVMGEMRTFSLCAGVFVHVQVQGNLRCGFFGAICLVFWDKSLSGLGLTQQAGLSVTQQTWSFRCVALLPSTGALSHSSISSQRPRAPILASQDTERQYMMENTYIQGKFSSLCMCAYVCLLNKHVG